MAKITCLSPDGTAFTADAGADDTVLDALLFEGCAVSYCCMVGMCGMCKADVHEGEVIMDDDDSGGLSEEDRQLGRILMCRSVAASDCVMAMVHGNAAEQPGCAIAVAVDVQVVSDRWVFCRLQVNEGASGLDLHAGQHLLLEWGSPGGDASSVRAYLGNRADSPQLEFYLDRHAGTLTDTDLPQVGSVMTLQAASGMTAADIVTSGPSLFIAEGAGAVPLLAVLQHLDEVDTSAVAFPHLLINDEGTLERWVMGRAGLENIGMTVHGDFEALAGELVNDIRRLVGADDNVSLKNIRAYVYARQDTNAAVRKLLLDAGLKPWKISVEVVN
ncbi:MAG: 2Fe-2S iron-sulfur cluster-binding protein [Aquisalimonadaceae bacterium]